LLVGYRYSAACRDDRWSVTLESCAAPADDCCTEPQDPECKKHDKDKGCDDKP